MERKFCSQCGMPLSECTCGEQAAHATDFGAVRADWEEDNRVSAYYIRRFDKIALIRDEVVVRQYHIGEFAKLLGSVGKGSASIIITNKRVISKQDSEYFGTSSTSVEEITLDSIAGVTNYYSQGFTIWRLVAAVVLLLIGLITFGTAFSRWSGFDFTKFLLALGFCAAAVYMGLKSRKPSYLFSVYASTVNQAMTMGANLRGKIFGSQGNGIVFQYKPTKEAVNMMCEIGACIVDLKQKGDYAVETWKKA